MSIDAWRDHTLGVFPAPHFHEPSWQYKQYPPEFTPIEMLSIKTAESGSDFTQGDWLWHYNTTPRWVSQINKKGEPVWTSGYPYSTNGIDWAHFKADSILISDTAGIPLFTVKDSPGRGKGLFAARTFEDGVALTVYLGLSSSNPEHTYTGMEGYTFQIDVNQRLNTRTANPAKTFRFAHFLNDNTVNPNAYVADGGKGGKRWVVYTQEEIVAGEEITINYGDRYDRTWLP